MKLPKRSSSIFNMRPEPPFNSGTPETAPPAVLAAARHAVQAITAQREKTARRVARRLGIAVD